MTSDEFVVGQGTGLRKRNRGHQAMTRTTETPFPLAMVVLQSCWQKKAEADSRVFPNPTQKPTPLPSFSSIIIATTNPSVQATEHQKTSRQFEKFEKPGYLKIRHSRDKPVFQRGSKEKSVKRTRVLPHDHGPNIPFESFPLPL